LRFSSAISAADTPTAVAEELLQGASAERGCDLAVFFFTAPLTPAAEEIAAQVREALGPRVFAGISCEGVIGGDTEVERRPGAALLTAHLPGVELQPWRIEASEWRAALSDDERLQQRIGTGAGHRGQMVLADPFTTPVDPFLERLDATLKAPTFGGMASGAQQAGGNLLLLDDEAHWDGAIGVGFGGELRIDTVVSQGCRPIGRTMAVTRAEGPFILELGRRPALEVAEEVLGALSDAEKELLQGGLFVGVVMNEYQSEFQRGDFLVRGVMGVDRNSGGLAVGDMVRAGQTVQFHVRDADTAHEDLSELLQPHAGGDVAGALLFSCNGRGVRMFPEPHHDVRTTRDGLSQAPVAGFFAMGELGPVGGKTFIHGHTASLALFRPPA
jgi:small ligand-binding sensory domain FIST